MTTPPKTRKVTWQVSASIEGKQWPIEIETNIPTGGGEFKPSLEKVAQWLLTNGLRPRVDKTASTSAGPNNTAPMKKKDAIAPPSLTPTCPSCDKEMLKSKHQDQNGGILYYCGQRTDNNNYCMCRGSVSVETGEVKVWEIEQKPIGGQS